MAKIAEKRCMECGKEIHGRPDKKFCDHECRVTYHNRMSRETNTLIRSINQTLRKNRLILSELNPTGKTKVLRSRLSEKGFNFEYFTSIYRTREGAEYHYCYEQGYLAVNKDMFLLVVKAPGKW